MLAHVQEGAVGPGGLWLVDRLTGRTLTVRFQSGDREDGQLLTVVGQHGDLTAGTWARVTWVEGLVATPDEIEAAYVDVRADQANTEGFCGSCWLGDERTGRGLAISLWDGPQALIRGEHGSHRRRLDLARRFGGRVTRVAELAVSR